MPKIQPIDSHARPQTGPSTQDVRVIKAITRANASNPTVQTQSPPAPTAPEAAAVVAPPVEGQEGNTETEGEAKPLSPQYAALARKEQAIRSREKDLQAKEAAFKSQESELQSLKDKIQRLSEPGSALEVLNEMGISYDQLVEQAVNQPDPQIKSIQQEMKAIRDAQTRSEETSKARETAQRDAAIKKIEQDITSLVETSPDFSTVKEAGAVSRVVDKIVKTFDESGTLMTIEEATQVIEDELLEEATKFTSYSKIKAKLTPAALEAPKAELKSTSQQQPLKTLTNSMTATKVYSPRERALLAAQYGPNWREKVT